MERIGPYKIVRRINTEGTGELYEAIHEQIQRRAAIKILRKELAEDPAAIQRFSNEARIVNLINHPSLVSIYETGQLENGAPYIVMEYLSGEMLRDRLHRLGGRMEPHKAMRTARQVASALAAAHAKQAVHRDLKPANIMLVADADTPDGERVKLLNFGLAKLTTGSAAGLLTQPGIILGTPTYMSPEQCENTQTVTDRSDIYGLGILLYEMLSGAPPFSDAEGPVQVMMAQMLQDPPPLANRAPDASPQLCALVHRMLAKSPATRPTAVEASAILASLSGSRNSAAFPGLLLAVHPAPTQPVESPTRMLPPPPPSEEPPSAVAQLLRHPTGRLVALAAALAVVLGIVGIVCAVRLLRPDPALHQPVTWIVVSEPAAAEVSDGSGQLLGRTPWQKGQPPGHGVLVVTVRKAGYGEETVVLDRAHGGQYKVTLPPLPPEPVAVVPSPSPVAAELPHQPKRSQHKPAKRRHRAR